VGKFEWLNIVDGSWYVIFGLRFVLYGSGPAPGTQHSTFNTVPARSFPE
jgi:hypothetical protein